MAFARFVLTHTAIALVLTVPGVGHAQTCASDADCAKGFRCQTNATASAPGVACTVDSDGGRTCITMPPPATVVTMSCQPASCASDADCGLAMVCHRQVDSNCDDLAPTVPKCDTAAGCPTDPVPQPVICTDTVVARCTYPWSLPCDADADCGAQFTCRPSQIGMCTGSAPAAGGDSGSAGSGGVTGSTTAAPVPVAPPMDGGSRTTTTCTIIESFPGYCQANVIACTSDTDCPLAWTCAGINGVTVATAPMPIDGGTPAAPPPSAMTPEPSTAAKTCQPPSLGGTWGGPTSGGSEGGYPTPTVGLLAPDAGVPTAKGASDPADSNTGGAVTAGTPPANTASTAPSPTTNSQGTKTSEATPVSARTSGGGCSVAGDASTAAPAWLLLSALGLLVSRRRAG